MKCSQYLNKQVMEEKLHRKDYKKKWQNKTSERLLQVSLCWLLFRHSVKDIYTVDRLLVDPVEAEGRKCVCELSNISLPAPP